VDFLDDAGFDHGEVVVVALLPGVVLGGEIHVENGGAHGAVVNDGAGVDEFKEATAHVVVILQ
jgi:hypothetical protein